MLTYKIMVVDCGGFGKFGKILTILLVNEIFLKTDRNDVMTFIFNRLRLSQAPAVAVFMVSCFSLVQ